MADIINKRIGIINIFVDNENNNKKFYESYNFIIIFNY